MLTYAGPLPEIDPAASINVSGITSTPPTAAINSLTVDKF